jgi:hypothetical protein
MSFSRMPPIAGVVAILCLLATTATAQNNVLNFTHEPIARDLLAQIQEGRIELEGSKKRGVRTVSMVTLRGKTNHFGIDITQNPPAYIDYHATVPGVRVWIAEERYTRDLNIQTDETGWWTMYVQKYSGVDLKFSFIYEKDGWITTKTNVITIRDEDDLDLAIQYIDPTYYNYAMLPFVENMIAGIEGYPVPFENAMVVTVGKSWASMHSDMLPHGDPGATVTAKPEKGIGPIYFNKSVIPDPGLTATSVDGGVAYINVPLGKVYRVTAQKDGVTYPTVKFRVKNTDPDDGVVLYIASPPDSLEGDNDSAPGMY